MCAAHLRPRIGSVSAVHTYDPASPPPFLCFHTWRRWHDLWSRKQAEEKDAGIHPVPCVLEQWICRHRKDLGDKCNTCHQADVFLSFLGVVNSKHSLDWLTDIDSCTHYTLKPCFAREIRLSDAFLIIEWKDLVGYRRGEWQLNGRGEG